MSKKLNTEWNLGHRQIELHVVLSESRPSINYILGGPSDDQYQSKRQQNKLLRVATVKARVNAIHTGGNHEETKPIDGPISFPPVSPNRVIVPHDDALVLTLCISSFNVHRVLIDPSSATDLLQLPYDLLQLLAFNKMGFHKNAKLSRANPLWFQ